MTRPRPARSAPARRHPARMGTLLAVALVPALALTGLWLWARDVSADDADRAAATAGSVPPSGEPALNTTLLSLRRAAFQISLDLNLSAFETAIDGLEATVNDRSCLAMSLNQRQVGNANADQIVIPASNQKVLVAAVALDVLGADFTYETSLVGPAAVDGVIDGDVYLVGGGDPLLSGEWYGEATLDRYAAFHTTPIDELARQLAASGVTQIVGSVLGDGSRYDDERFAPGWGPGVAGVEAGPYDALLVNDARVFGDEQRGTDPSEAGAREFARILTEHGIDVTGVPGAGVAPVDLAPLATIYSRPLTDVIAEMLTNSDNNTAEMLVKEIGFATSGIGTRRAGLDAMFDTIVGWGVPVGGMVLDDGSGLSLNNRISCNSMLGVLEHVGMNSAVGEGLAVAGRTGTLSNVFGDTSLNGRLVAKTGTLNNPPFDEDPPAVKALSGYLSAAGDQIAFALILNGNLISDQSEYRPVWAEFVNAIESYPAVADPASLGPR